MWAYIAAAVKAKVTLIEAHKMGGDCLNYGCVPKLKLGAMSLRPYFAPWRIWCASLALFIKALLGTQP